MRGTIVSRHLKRAAPQAESAIAGAGFGADIAIAEAWEGNGKPGVYHRLAEIQRADAAGRDDPAIVVDILLFAHDGSPANEARKLFGRLLPTRPGSVGALATLSQLGRIDAVEAHRDPAEIERVTIGGARGPADVLRESGRGDDKGKGSDFQFHGRSRSAS